MVVSVIIVNWNGKKHLEKCLPSLNKQSYPKIEVILVDNASRDGSVEYVKKNFPKTKIIINRQNLGFAQANNIGYRASQGEYILFLNNDTKVTKNFLTELIKVLESDEEIGGAQSKLLLMDTPEKLDSVGAYLTNTGFLYHYGTYKADSKKYDRQINLYSVKGASMMFKREVLEKVKTDDEIFDKRFFAYFEETDMCHRVWLAGYKIVYAPKSVIYHKLGATSARFSDPFVQYHSYKNRICSYIKNLGSLSFVKILPVHLAFCEIASLTFLLQGKLLVFFAIQRAIFWNLKDIRATLQRRENIQRKIRAREDKAFYPTIVKNVDLKYYFYLLRGLEHYKDKS